MKKQKSKTKHSVGTAWGIVLLSFALAVLLSVAVIVVANEVFALTPKIRDGVVVIPEGADSGSVSRILREAGLIRFPLIYRVYAALRSWDKAYLSGEFSLNTSMSYDEMRYALSPRRGVREQIKLTIPEGFTTDEIIDRVLSLGIGTREGFANVIENGGTFGYDLVEQIPKVDGRTYRLDGYLFPDTYFVYADSDENEIIAKLLANFNRKFDERLRERAAELGYSVDEVVRLASIVEREAYYREDMPLIASVFGNRMKNTGYPFLESDATVRYAKQLTGNKDALTAEDLDAIAGPYNTYRVRGLPPGAICSPGYDAILAVLYPAETDYYFFVCTKEKTTIFSRTYEEHRRAVASLR